ncbi:MFS transporter [Rhizobium sp. AB2/73]|uniref:MFS transporter n=1 Tax=Rhizobium sp. AB2/73 TaxID=2795216 RepID=UPI001C5D44D4|nr:MFS transporter [Rhizobium sp. AB2/73]QYA11929.1 MFS transporter [Rhizobium sp. AB2/73]UEQ82140.1 MFS transporter [Rhizobium sp. AB2/73]
MPVGLLTDIAESTQSEIGHAGTLVTAYAIAFATGGIALSFVTASWSRRLVLFASLAAALLSNLVLAYSNDLALLIAVRIAGGSAQGWFVGAAIAVAMSVVPPDRIGRAVSIVVSGFAASTALGVPAGVGLASAYGWHASFLAVSVLVLVVMSGVAISIPSSIKSPVAPANNAEQIRHALSPRVLAILAVTMILFAGEYAAFTYISPFLQEADRISSETIGWYILGFGIASALGSLLGGRVADANARMAVILANLAIPIAIIGLLTFGSSTVGSSVMMIAWGVVAVASVPGIQTLVAEAAGPGRDVAGVLPAAAINVGIAAGSLIGGLSVSAWGLTAPVIVGITLSILVLPATILVMQRHVPFTT